MVVLAGYSVQDSILTDQPARPLGGALSNSLVHTCHTDVHFLRTQSCIAQTGVSIGPHSRETPVIVSRVLVRLMFESRTCKTRLRTIIPIARHTRAPSDVLERPYTVGGRGVPPPPLLLPPLPPFQCLRLTATILLRRQEDLS